VRESFQLTAQAFRTPLCETRYPSPIKHGIEGEAGAVYLVVSADRLEPALARRFR